MQCVFDKNHECKIFSEKHKLVGESDAYFPHLWCVACRLNEILNILKSDGLLEDIIEVLRKDWDSKEDEIWGEY